MKDFPQPNNIKELQGFLGAVNFYRRFIPSAAKILLPLTGELKGGRKGPELLTWSPPMLAAFNDIKEALMKAVCLAFPTETADLALATDASATHVGAVLQQREGHSSAWRPLGFFSAKLEAAQLSYSAFDRELCAIFAGIRHFRHHLEGRRFTIWTDHKPLTFALSRVSDSWTARQQRQLSYIAEFTADIVHVPGTQNMVADLMSRPPQAVPSPGPATAAGVKVPSGSLAASQVVGGTAGASLHLVAAVTAVDGVDLEAMAWPRTRSHVLVSSSFTTTSLYSCRFQHKAENNSGVTSPQATGGRWYRYPGGEKCSWRFTHLHTRVSGPPGGYCQPGSYGKAWPLMSATGAGNAANASVPKSPASQQPLYSPYQSPTAVSPISTWTWWAP